MSKVQNLLKTLSEDDDGVQTPPTPGMKPTAPAAAPAAKSKDPNAKPEATGYESDNPELAKKFGDGAVITAKDFEGPDEDDLTNYFIENDLHFHADWADIEEIHLFAPQDIMPNNPKEGLGGWPVCMKDGENLKLESSYGDGAESYIICKKAKISHGH